MPRISSSVLLLLSAAMVAVSAQQVLEACGKQVQIASEVDLSSIASCSSFSGTVTISGSGISAVAWPALKSLTGAIKISSNARLTTLALDGLQTSTGSITLFNNTLLSSVNLANLKSLNGLEIITAPNLRQLSLPNMATLNTLKIEDTGLDNSGLLPWSTLPKITDMGVSNNKFLKTIDMPGLTTVSGRLIIAANGLMEGGQGKGISLLMPNLTSISNCTLRHLTDLKVPSLTQVISSLSFDETNLETIDAPHLKTVGQTLSIVSNNLLSNVSFPELTTIGGALLIANNTALTSVSGFNQLKDISGALQMRGAFNNVSLPAVSTVQGDMSVLSSSKDFDCQTLSKVKASALGKTVCLAQVKSAKPSSNANNDGLDDSSVGSSAVVHAVHYSKEVIWATAAILSSLVYVI